MKDLLQRPRNDLVIPARWVACYVTIKTEWFDDNRQILVTEVREGWTWQDVQDNMNKLHNLAMSVNYPAGLIVILARTMSIPPSGFVQNSRNIIALHQQLGLHTVVYVTRTPYTQTLWRETIDTLAGNTTMYFIANTPDDALEIVESRS